MSPGEEKTRLKPDGSRPTLKVGAPHDPYKCTSARAHDQPDSPRAYLSAAARPARKHLVVAEVTNQALLHFVLNPAYPLRDKLVRDIAMAAAPYDGVNIDFELLRPSDSSAFLKFLSLLKKAIGAPKLIMGMPFYGRAWGDKSPAGAYRHSSLSLKKEEHAAVPGRDAEGISYFRFSETVNLVLYYDDALSTRQRAQAYAAASVDKIGFWRLGQEDPEIWRVICADKP